MKSFTAVCPSGTTPAINPSGRISRHSHHSRDGENAEMKMYLSKLKDLVPFMPKNRKLSKLEIIQHVIDYICDLQSELETHPEINNFDAATALSLSNGTHHLSGHHEDHNNGAMDDRLSGHLASTPSPQIRQPLAARQSPNTILTTSAHPSSVISNVILSSTAPVHHVTTSIPPAVEKQTSDNKNNRQYC